MKALWCHSHLVWLVFWGFYPYMRLFLFRKLFCSLFLLFFFEEWRERRWEGRPRGRCMVCKNESIELPQRTKSWIQMLSSEVAKLTIQLLYGSRNCCLCKLHVLSCVESSIFLITAALAIQGSMHIFSLYVLLYTTRSWLLLSSCNLSLCQLLPSSYNGKLSTRT